MGAVLPGDLLRINQPEVGLVDQRRGLQGVSGAFLPHKTFGNAAQFGVHEWNEAFQGRRITVTPGKQ